MYLEMLIPACICIRKDLLNLLFYRQKHYGHRSVLYVNNRELPDLEYPKCNQKYKSQ